MWTETDAAQLKSLLNKKFHSEVIVSRPTTQAWFINQELNRLIRPGLSPALNYCGAYRLGLKLIADFHVRLEFRPGLVRAFVKDGPIDAEGRCEYQTSDKKTISVNIAICEAVMFALQQLEQLEVPSG